jgi:hypothetical protein
VGWGEQRIYRSDDRDLDGGDNDLAVFPGENGDWYVVIRPHGERLSRACVRVTTSGTPPGKEGASVAVSKLYRALGGERIDGLAGAAAADAAAWQALALELAPRCSRCPAYATRFDAIEVDWCDDHDSTTVMTDHSHAPLIRSLKRQ